MLDLQAIEEIKQLKARYFRSIDTCDLETLKDTFAEDATAFFKGGYYELTLNGWAEMEPFYAQSFTPQRFGMHHGHMPEISVDGDTATGIWYLQDIFINLEDNTRLTGSALYTDTYKKINGEWKIFDTRYKRLFEELQQRAETDKIVTKPVNG